MTPAKHLTQNKSLDQISHYILHAEGKWERGLGKTRFLIEKTQDIIASHFPFLARILDFSVGDFNIKPSTAETAVKWVKKNKKIKVIKTEAEIVPAIMSSHKSRSIVKTILLMLRENHPYLKHFSWKQIEKNKRLIMKLYSGYMGAGGDWETWRNTRHPGKIAQSRMVFL